MTNSKKKIRRRHHTSIKSYIVETGRNIRLSLSAPSLRKVECGKSPDPHGLLIYQRRGRYVLQCRSSGIKDDDFIHRCAPRFFAADYFAKLRVHISPCNQSLIQRMVEISDGRALLEHIDHYLVSGEKTRIQLLFTLIIGPDGRDECSRGHILSL